jgi:pimeloyl-ACP methyl ester carboxylesterase
MIRVIPPPGPPVVTRATPLDGGVAFALSPANESDANLVTGYRVELSTSDETIVEEYPAEADGTTAAVLRGLQNDEPYSFSSLALSSGQLSSKTSTISVLPQPASEWCKEWAREFAQPVLLVHGWNADSGTWNNVVEHFTDCGSLHDDLKIEDGVVSGLSGRPFPANLYTATFTGFINGTGAPDNPCAQALELERFLGAVTQAAHASKTVIVAHSQGGLVARLYMQWGNNGESWLELLESGGTCPTLEGPYLSACADLADNHSNFFYDDIAALITYGTPHKGVDDVPSPPHLAPNSCFIRNINDFDAVPLPRQVPIINLIGDKGVLTESGTDCVVSSQNQTMEGLDGFSHEPFSSTVIKGKKHWSGRLMPGCGLGRQRETADFAGIVGEGLSAVGEGLHAPVLTVTLGSPANISVSDVSGRTVSKERREIWAATYEEMADESGHTADVVQIPFPHPGDYEIEVIPESGALPSDTFSLEITLNGATTVLAQDLRIDEIAGAPFVAAFTRIDILPGSEENLIVVRRRGVVPVAILGGESFDAGLVDPNSLTFGATGDEASLRQCGGLEDTDGDGFLDLVCQFNVADTGFAAGGVEGRLKGEMFDGSPVLGVDSITTR